MRLYLAGPLFTEAERAWLDRLAARLRAERFDCFVPHEQFATPHEVTVDQVYATDVEGIRAANALVAWVDGPMCDDGTACEIGLFAGLVASGDPHYRGIVGIATDLRLERRRHRVAGDGLNLFVHGAIRSAGELCWSIEEAVAVLDRWRDM